MAQRLKVYCWSDGLSAYTVATTSRAKALAAWGFHRDLFRDGEAKEITAGPDYEAAKAAPGQTITRSTGASVPPSRRRKGSAKQADQRRAVERARLQRLGEAIAQLSEEERSAEAEIERERKALAGKEARLVDRMHARREALEQKRDEVRARLGKD